jgi:hypothetical protein
MMHHLDTYQASIHYNESGAEVQAAQVAAVITNMMAKR